MNLAKWRLSGKSKEIELKRGTQEGGCELIQKKERGRFGRRKVLIFDVCHMCSIRFWVSVGLVPQGFNFLDGSSLSVDPPYLIKKVTKLIFHVFYKLSFILESFRVVYFRKAIVNLFIPSHFKFFLIKDSLVPKTHQHLNGNFLSIGVLNEILFTLMRPVFSLFF